MEVFFRVSFHRDFLQLIDGLVLTDFNARSVLGILCPTNSGSCKGYILRICSKSGQNVLFHLVSTCPKKIIHKEIDDSCHGFSCSWTSTCGIQRFFQMQLPCLIAHVIQRRRLYFCAMAPCFQCSQTCLRDCQEYST